MSAQTRSLALVVPSRLALVDEVCEKVSRFFSDRGFVEEDIYAFDLSVREGVINAMKHGNHWNELLLVSVLIDVTGGDCVIKISDAGNYRASIPKAPGELMAPNGRGITIMQSLMDSVEFNWKCHGLEVGLRKRVVSAEHQGVTG